MRPRLLLGVLGAASLALATGCGPAEKDLPPADAVYAARGEVVATPGPGNRSVLVHHESVPGFVSRAGEAAGMDSMTMPFAVASDVSMAELEEGDPVEMEFEVRWETDPILRIVRLEELPAGTELDFRPLPDAEPEPTKTGGDEAATEAGAPDAEDEGEG